jgi:RND family efflux transporter MFP subunit
MKKILVIPFLVVLAALIGAFLLVATAPSVENVTPDRAVPAVRTLAPTANSVTLTVRSQGTVAPRTESAVVPEVSGRVVWVSPALVSGGFFLKGETLLRIDPRDYEMARDRARSSVARAEGEAEFAKSELARQRRLSERKVASSQQLSSAHRADHVARANLADARVALEQAEWDLARIEITAPFEGRVREESVDVGQFVSRGAAIASIYATDYAEIRLPIADDQLAYLRLPNMREANEDEGPAVRLRARFAGVENEWMGRVVRTEGEIDPRSRMVHVVARVEHPYRTDEDAGDARAPLAVGLFVQAEIEGTVLEDVIVVPRYAMRDDSHLLVVDATDRLHTRAVEVLRIDRDDVLIRNDLAAGERICVSPIQIVVEGMQVKPVAEESSATTKRAS